MMGKGTQRKQSSVAHSAPEKLSLAPLDFETAIRAALAAGPMPKSKAKRKPKKRKGGK